MILRPPAHLLEERRRIGLDVRDEVWEGVLHMVPPPSARHQEFGGDLLAALKPVAKKLGIVAFYETGLLRPDSPTLDYRIPDLMFARREHVGDRGVERRAELVIELLSEDDESREKLGFYEQVGVSEALLVDPVGRDFELYSLRGGKFHAALPDDQGAVRSQALGVTLAKVAGPLLSLRWAGGAAEH